jgi:protein PhnA
MTDLISSELMQRSKSACELCEEQEDLSVYEVSKPPTETDSNIVVCGRCQSQLAGDTDLDVKHWFCLQQSIWSEVSAVQVMSYRLLHNLRHESWAMDLLDQAYLEPEVLAWAESGIQAREEGDPKTVDSNGTPLADGDSVTLIKGLDVKGANFTAKRGTLVKNIRLSDDPELIEGRVNGVGIFLKTCFLKKST